MWGSLLGGVVKGIFGPLADLGKQWMLIRQAKTLIILAHHPYIYYLLDLIPASTINSKYSDCIMSVIHHKSTNHATAHKLFQQRNDK